MKESKSALNKFAIQYWIDGNDWIDPDLFPDNAKQSITYHLIDRRQTKVKLILSIMMEKVDLRSGEVIVKEAAFHTKTEANFQSTDSCELFSKVKETVLESWAKFQRQGSDWRFRSVLSLDLHTVKYVPLGGSSYSPLPRFLAAKKAITNLKNADDGCFKWAITRVLNPVEEHSEHIDKHNSRKIKRSSIGRNWNFQAIWVISINLKITILQFLLIYSVKKIYFILLE